MPRWLVALHGTPRSKNASNEVYCPASYGHLERHREICLFCDRPLAIQYFEKSTIAGLFLGPLVDFTSVLVGNGYSGISS